MKKIINYEKLMLVSLALLMILGLVLLNACATEEAADGDRVMMDEEQAETYNVEEAEDDDRTTTDHESRGNDKGRDIDRKLIKTGNIELIIDDIEQSRQAINTHLRNISGYIQDSAFRADKVDTIRGDMTIRVPQNEFEKTMEHLAELGEVKSRRTSSDDVTMEYVDLDARLSNLERQEERYLEILNEADTIEEIMNVEERLVEVREEIESFTARLEQLDNQISYSTINVSLREKQADEKAEFEAEGFEGLTDRTITAFISSVNTAASGLANFIVFLFAALPYMAIIAVVGGLVYKGKKVVVRYISDKSHDK